MNFIAIADDQKMLAYDRRFVIEANACIEDAALFANASDDFAKVVEQELLPVVVGSRVIVGWGRILRVERRGIPRRKGSACGSEG